MVDFIQNTKLRFPGQHSQEKVKVIFRRSVFFLILGYLFTIIAAGITWVVSIQLPASIIILQQGLYNQVFDFVILIILLLIFYTGFLTWVHYYLDVYIVTNQRVLTIDQVDFFNREVSEADIGNVQDVEVIVNGFFATVFNFGDVRIQTAGADSRTLFFNDIPYPYKAKDLILQFAEQNRQVELHQAYTYDPNTIKSVDQNS